MRDGDTGSFPPPADAGATTPHAAGSGGGRRAEPAPGPRYRPLRFHARGGLGEVHVALDEELGREVALKTIRPELAADPSVRERFLREAEVTARLEHPGVVPVYGMDADAEGGAAYAMRFVAGESLHDAALAFHAALAGRTPLKAHLFRGTLQAQQDARAYLSGLRPLLGRFVAVCDAVAYAHSRGVVHRDLKPQNVMLGGYGETLLVDWGLARAAAPPGGDGGGHGPPLAGAPGGLTQAGRAVGTPAYMSPEQAAGDLEHVGPASDVYGLGATLYFLLAGRPPFAGGDLGEVLARVRAGEFPPPGAVDPRTPAALGAVCLKAMARDPGGRYATASALAEDVGRWLADEPVAAAGEPLGERLDRLTRRHSKALAWGLIAAVAALFFYHLAFSEYHEGRVEAERARAQEALAEKAKAEREAAEALGRAAEAEGRAAAGRAEGRQAWARVGLADRWARAGQHAAGMTLAEAAAVGLRAEDAELRLALAAAAAQAAAAAGRDATLPEAERARLAERYAAWAVGQMREAARGGVGADAVGAEEGLNPLRGRADFREAVRGLRPGPRPDKPPG